MSEAIRAADVSVAASRIAAIGAVRAVLVAKQRQVAETANVVMEGRDIGTVVFPHARVKIFLDADPAERVRRRTFEQDDARPRSWRFRSPNVTNATAIARNRPLCRRPMPLHRFDRLTADEVEDAFSTRSAREFPTERNIN